MSVCVSRIHTHSTQLISAMGTGSWTLFRDIVLIYLPPAIADSHLKGSDVIIYDTSSEKIAAIKITIFRQPNERNIIMCAIVCKGLSKTGGLHLVCIELTNAYCHKE